MPPASCLGLGLRERGPLGLGGREVHGRGLSRPSVRFCSALGVDGVACGSVAAHPEPANATTTLNAERIDVRVSGRPRESLLVGRRRSGHRVSRRPHYKTPRLGPRLGPRFGFGPSPCEALVGKASGKPWPKAPPRFGGALVVPWSTEFRQGFSASCINQHYIYIQLSSPIKKLSR